MTESPRPPRGLPPSGISPEAWRSEQAAKLGIPQEAIQDLLKQGLSLSPAAQQQEYTAHYWQQFAQRFHLDVPAGETPTLVGLRLLQGVPNDPSARIFWAIQQKNPDLLQSCMVPGVTITSEHYRYAMEVDPGLALLVELLRGRKGEIPMSQLLGFPDLGAVEQFFSRPNAPEILVRLLDFQTDIAADIGTLNALLSSRPAYEQRGALWRMVDLLVGHRVIPDQESLGLALRSQIPGLFQRLLDDQGSVRHEGLQVQTVEALLHFTSDPEERAQLMELLLQRGYRLTPAIEDLLLTLPVEEFIHLCQRLIATGNFQPNGVFLEAVFATYPAASVLDLVSPWILENGLRTQFATEPFQQALRAAVNNPEDPDPYRTAMLLFVALPAVQRGAVINRLGTELLALAPKTAARDRLQRMQEDFEALSHRYGGGLPHMPADMWRSHIAPAGGYFQPNPLPSLPPQLLNFFIPGLGDPVSKETADRWIEISDEIAGQPFPDSPGAALPDAERLARGEKAHQEVVQAVQKFWDLRREIGLPRHPLIGRGSSKQEALLDIEELDADQLALDSFDVRSRELDESYIQIFPRMFQRAVERGDRPLVRLCCYLKRSNRAMTELFFRPYDLMPVILRSPDPDILEDILEDDELWAGRPPAGHLTYALDTTLSPEETRTFLEHLTEGTLETLSRKAPDFLRDLYRLITRIHPANTEILLRWLVERRVRCKAWADVLAAALKGEVSPDLLRLLLRIPRDGGVVAIGIGPQLIQGVMRNRAAFEEEISSANESTFAFLEQLLNEPGVQLTEDGLAELLCIVSHQPPTVAASLGIYERVMNFLNGPYTKVRILHGVSDAFLEGLVRRWLGQWSWSPRTELGFSLLKEILFRDPLVRARLLDLVPDLAFQSMDMGSDNEMKLMETVFLDAAPPLKSLLDQLVTKMGVDSLGDYINKLSLWQRREVAGAVMVRASRSDPHSDDYQESMRLLMDPALSLIWTNQKPDQTSPFWNVIFHFDEPLPGLIPMLSGPSRRIPPPTQGDVSLILDQARSPKYAAGSLRVLEWLLTNRPFDFKRPEVQAALVKDLQKKDWSWSQLRPVLDLFARHQVPFANGDFVVGLWDRLNSEDLWNLITWLQRHQIAGLSAEAKCELSNIHKLHHDVRILEFCKSSCGVIPDPCLRSGEATWSHLLYHREGDLNMARWLIQVRQESWAHNSRALELGIPVVGRVSLEKRRGGPFGEIGCILTFARNRRLSYEETQELLRPWLDSEALPEMSDNDVTQVIEDIKACCEMRNAAPALVNAFVQRGMFINGTHLHGFSNDWKVRIMRSNLLPGDLERFLGENRWLNEPLVAQMVEVLRPPHWMQGQNLSREEARNTSLLDFDYILKQPTQETPALVHILRKAGEQASPSHLTKALEHIKSAAIPLGRATDLMRGLLESGAVWERSHLTLIQALPEDSEDQIRVKALLLKLYPR